MTRSSAIAYLNELTVAPITSTVRDIPTEVVLDASDGMRTSCAANFDHLQTVAKSRLGKLIGKLAPEKWPEAKQAVNFALGFD